jgi:hypothetical protein
MRALVLGAIAIVGCASSARPTPVAREIHHSPPDERTFGVERSAASLAEFGTELGLSIDLGPLRDDASPSAEIFVFNRAGRTWEVPRIPADGLVELSIDVRDAKHTSERPPEEPKNLRDSCGPVLNGGPVAIAPGARVSLGCIATRVDVHAIDALLVSGRFSFRAKDGSTIALTAVERELVRRPVARIEARPRARGRQKTAKEAKSLLDLLDVAIESLVSFPLSVDPRALRVEILGEQGFIEDSLQMFAPRVVAHDTCAKDALCALLAQSWRSTHPNDVARPVFDPNDLAPVIVPAQARTSLPPRGTFGPSWEGRLPRLHETPIRTVLEVQLEGRPLVFSSTWVRLSGP